MTIVLGELDDLTKMGLRLRDKCYKVKKLFRETGGVFTRVYPDKHYWLVIFGKPLPPSVYLPDR